MRRSQRAARRLTLPSRLAPASLAAFAVAGAALYLLLTSEAIRSERPLVALALSAILIVLWASVMGMMRQVQARVRRQAAHTEYAALHDPVTELPNRILLHDRVQQAVLAADRDGETVAVVLLDLNRFKEVNDTLGRHNGDLLLAEAGARLRGLLRASDTVARHGGDEFALVLRTVSDAHGARTAAESARAALAEPITLQGIEIETESSAGIALFPEHGSAPDRLIQRAEAAMEVAKDNHSGVEVYDPELDRSSASRLTLVGELRRAIADGSLLLHYQPQVDTRSGTVAGVEALVRWQHPTRGLVPPDEFIPLAEGSGLIRLLTLEVLDQAIAQCSRWRAEGIELTMAVNLSARNLLDLQLPDDVGVLLAKHDLQAGCLELEVTESTMMSDPLRARGVMTRLSRMGMALAIDDFGTGYSSLAYLRQLPLDSLKVDRSFVMRMHEEDGDAVIVRSTIGLAQSLGLRSVAEGVETQGVLDELRVLGCDLLQGYFISRPLPAAELERWLADCPWAARAGAA